MNTACVKNTSLLLLAILLGAVLSVLCMNIATHTQTHAAHYQHDMTYISCAQSQATHDACIPGHGSLMHTLTQASTTTAVPLLLLLLTTFSLLYTILAYRPRTVGKQFYKTRWRLTQEVYAEHILSWLVVLQKQDSYRVAVA